MERQGLQKSTALSDCEQCGSGFVYPTSWERAEEERWTVVLRCPECELFSEGTFDDDVVTKFDETLEEGTEVLLRDLKLLVQANMLAEIERFARALHADAILPEDF